jgi:hypothetical protein
MKEDDDFLSPSATASSLACLASGLRVRLLVKHAGRPSWLGASAAWWIVLLTATDCGGFLVSESTALARIYLAG